MRTDLSFTSHEHTCDYCLLKDTHLLCLLECLDIGCAAIFSLKSTCFRTRSIAYWIAYCAILPIVRLGLGLGEPRVVGEGGRFYP
jgi:hypothetical protein